MRYAILLIAFAILSAPTQALEATAGNNSIQLQQMKRKISEQMIGLTAIVEALATKLKTAEDGLAELRNQIEECSAEGGLLTPSTGECITISTGASNAPCEARSVNTNRGSMSVPYASPGEKVQGSVSWKTPWYQTAWTEYSGNMYVSFICDGGRLRPEKMWATSTSSGFVNESLCSEDGQSCSGLACNSWNSCPGPTQTIIFNNLNP